MKLASLGILLTVMSTIIVAFDPSDYLHSQTLSSQYRVYWNADLDKSVLNLGLEVETEGWIGFGIGEFTSGSMPGSDMVLITFEDKDDSTRATITDAYATEFATPQADECQSWVLESSVFKNGKRYVEVSRKFNTSDTQDRVITSGSNRIVYAFGANSEGMLTYHQTRRGATQITFWESSPSTTTTTTTSPAKPHAHSHSHSQSASEGISSDMQQADFFMMNYQVQPIKTSYVCISHHIPLLPGQPDHHVIEFEPVIDKIELAHHLVMYLCWNTTLSSHAHVYYKNPQICPSPIGSPGTGCTSILYSWAVGMGSLKLPIEAGYRMGYSEDAFQFVVIEMHYDNPPLTSGVVDNSGIRLHYTSTLRKYDAATMMVGDPYVSLPPIPPRLDSVPYETTCPSECTQEFSHEIQVFAEFFHMHEIGSQMWVTQYRDNKLLRTTSRIEYYSFDFQQQTPVNYTIKPGDRLNVHCIYDSSNRAQETRFGPDSSEEMCVDIFSYYPRLKIRGQEYGYCGYAPGEVLGLPEPITLCGNVDGIYTNQSLKLVPNPNYRDLEEGLPRIFGSAPNSKCENPKYRNVSLIIGVAVGVVCVVVLVVGIAAYLVSRKNRTGYINLSEKY